MPFSTNTKKDRGIDWLHYCVPEAKLQNFFFNIIQCIAVDRFMELYREHY